MSSTTASNNNKFTAINHQIGQFDDNKRINNYLSFDKSSEDQQDYFSSNLYDNNINAHDQKSQNYQLESNDPYSRNHIKFDTFEKGWKSNLKNQINTLVK